MSLIPRWFSHFPKSARPDFFNLSKFFDEMGSELTPFSSSHSGLSISSDDKHIFVEAHVPGLTAKEVDVSIDQDGVLWIKGEKREVEEDKKRKFYRQCQTSFSYCVPLWDEVDPQEEPKANCKDGVMHITFAKRKEKQKEAKKIRVD